MTKYYIQTLSLLSCTLFPVFSGDIPSTSTSEFASSVTNDFVSFNKHRK